MKEGGGANAHFWLRWFNINFKTFVMDSKNLCVNTNWAGILSGNSIFWGGGKPRDQKSGSGVSGP